MKDLSFLSHHQKSCTFLRFLIKALILSHSIFMMHVICLCPMNKNSMWLDISRFWKPHNTNIDLKERSEVKGEKTLIYLLKFFSIIWDATYYRVKVLFTGDNVVFFYFIFWIYVVSLTEVISKFVYECHWSEVGPTEKSNNNQIILLDVNFFRESLFFLYR